MEFGLAKLNNFVAKNNNPFLIDIVVSKVLEYVPDEDLASCRSVCQLWKDGVDNEKELRLTVRVSNEEEAATILARHLSAPRRFRIVYLYIRESDLELPAFVSLLNYALPTLSLLSLNECRVVDLASLHSLMRKVCAQVSKFDMGTVKSHDGQYFKYLPIPSATEDGVNLTFGKMRSFEYISYNDDEEEATWLSDVCLAFPNLRNLIVTNMYQERMENMRRIDMPHLKSLTLRMIPHEDSQMVNLCMSCHQDRMMGRAPEHSHGDDIGGLRAAHVNILMQLGLKLEELTVWNVHRGLDSDLFKKFIQSFGQTLQRLTLLQYKMDTVRPKRKCNRAAPSPFPNDLPCLTSLKIARPFVKNLNQVLASCPNVSQLEFDFYEGADWLGILPNRVTTSSKVGHLALETIDAKSLTKLAQIFKTVRIFEILEAQDSQLAVIFKFFTDLETLVVHDPSVMGGAVTQQGFTGMSSKSVDMLNSGDDLSIAEIDNLRVAPFIGDLTGLRTLFLVLETGDPYLIKNVVTYGLVHCPSFKVLILSCGNIDEVVTPQFLTFMREEGYVIMERKQNAYLFVRIFAVEDPFYSTEEDEEDD